jgi:hypothetical protein
MFKKFITAMLFSVLTIAPAFACKPDFPNGVSASALTIHIEGCTFDNYAPVDGPGVCANARLLAVQYLNAISSKSWSYENVKNDANLIVYLNIHQGANGDDNTDVVSLKTYGLGITGDGVTLFTAVGAPGEAAASFESALDELNRWVTNGWICQ